jgi:uncharacterized OB-fold protein
MSLFEPIKCEKCGNDDQDKLRSVPSAPYKDRRTHGRQTVTLVGWRCDKCGHLTPEPKRS